MQLETKKLIRNTIKGSPPKRPRPREPSLSWKYAEKWRTGIQKYSQLTTEGREEQDRYWHPAITAFFRCLFNEEQWRPLPLFKCGDTETHAG